MSTIPVVWCTDPNSSNKKPIAFALEGIQVQGNLSEQHVLALRELVDAAAEGRLLLPTDGVIVVLECGVGVGSVIIQDSNKQRDLNRKVSTTTTFTSNKENNSIELSTNEVALKHRETKEEMLYEFLCCARCMTGCVKSCHSHAQTSEIVAKYLATKKIRGLKRHRSANMRVTNIRRKNIVKTEKRLLQKETKTGERKVPMYATVDKQRKHKNRKLRELESLKQQQSDPIENINDAIESTANGTGRKTSFDSTCTISSLDSGCFMDMQNKLENAKNIIKNAQAVVVDSNVEIKIHLSEESDLVHNIERPASSWNRLTVPSQSRNRRKSYEEFKSLFCDHNQRNHATVPDHQMTTSSHRSSSDSIKSRRKSYEEFKSATSVSCDNNCKPATSSISNAIVNELFMKSNDNAITSPLTDESLGDSQFKMKRKNSKRISTTRKPNFTNNNNKVTATTTTNDILKQKNLKNLNECDEEQGKKLNYDKNLELFKNHCSVNDIKKIKNCLPCGPIYDIIQRESDMDSKKFKRYDKYMTYGTLYEILHRKTDENDQFERKRTLSEKFSKKRINYARIDFKADSGGKVTAAAAATDSCDENLNSISATTTTTSASSMKQGSTQTKGANNQLSITSVCSQQLSTIYDILQTKKLETAHHHVNDVNGHFKKRSRFLVRKITEEELIESRKENDSVDKIKEEQIKDPTPCQVRVDHHHQQQQQPPLIVKKQNRMRRISNILSYTPRTLIEGDGSTLKLPTLESEIKKNSNLEAKIDELYSHLNRMAQKIENQHLLKIESEKNSNKMYKSTSLDMLAHINENDVAHVKPNPLRKISVPSRLPLKPQSKKATRRLSEFTRGEFLNEKA